jgi:hypothetical protein
MSAEIVILMLSTAAPADASCNEWPMIKQKTARLSPNVRTDRDLRSNGVRLWGAAINRARRGRPTDKLRHLP